MRRHSKKSHVQQTKLYRFNSKGECHRQIRKNMANWHSSLFEKQHVPSVTMQHNECWIWVTGKSAVLDRSNTSPHFS
ncbi:hypothetical protein DPMN_156044 [Dreissena polymorpha]|uniref:Uncharacterized protein n=1 Tax=Dreissena polymorpha TaxID=45954 RepID=A0A9D4JBH2_DREPO|nr:hypothetical protein DPMN_156044 [Dreissena polymorpha]